MRVGRIVEEGAAFYHVMSRVAGREKVFRAESEREAFRRTKVPQGLSLASRMTTHGSTDTKFVMAADIQGGAVVADCGT